MKKEIQDLIYKLNGDYWKVEEEWQVDHVDTFDMKPTYIAPHLQGPFYTLTLKEVSEDKFKRVANCIIDEKSYKDIALNKDKLLQKVEFELAQEQYKNLLLKEENKKLKEFKDKMKGRYICLHNSNYCEGLRDALEDALEMIEDMRKELCTMKK